MGVLIAIEQTEIGELLPEVARHFVEERVFAVNDFVVGKGENEIFAEGIDQRKSDFVVFVLTIDGISGKIFQGIVHPAHIPFKAEAEAAEISGARNAGPGGGFFGNGENAGKPFVGDRVHGLEELDSVEIFATSEAIGNPFAGFAGVVEVKHGSDGVHAEAVNVVLVEPEKGVGEEIVANFVATVIIDESAPVWMSTLAGVGVFEQVGTVKLREAVGVARKMGGSPIEQNTDRFLVAAIDEIHEISR